MCWLDDAGFNKPIHWTEKRDGKHSPLPDWASFLIWLGSVNRRLQIDNRRVFCVALLPTRICCSSLAAFGSIANSLTNQKNDLSWDLFLKCEEGLNVYFLYTNKKGNRKQLEGELGRVIEYGSQKLRSIKIISSRQEFQKLTIQISQSKFLDSNVSFHPHHRSRLLNDLTEISDFFNRTLENFNENSLLLLNPENVVVTNRAGWERENENFFMEIIEDQTPHLLPVKEILLTRFCRTLLCSPRSKDLQNTDTPLAILDGLDALRSREYIKARNVLILLDHNEYSKDAADVLSQFSAYCLKEQPHEFDNLPTHCPDGIEVQFYLFEQTG